MKNNTQYVYETENNGHPQQTAAINLDENSSRPNM
jgi:hypothetical protein